MATKEKEKKGINVSRAIAAAGLLLKTGISEMRFQNMLDRYQLANLKADYSVDARTKRADAMKERAMKLDAEFRGVLDPDTGKQIERVSNWQPLGSYFNETLAHLKESDFAADASVRAGRDLERAKLAKVTKEQEQVIITYHKHRASANWDKVLQIRVILEQKNLLKKAPAKLPTEEELAAINAGQE